MNIVVDIVALVIVLLCIFQGFRKGLVGMIFSIASFIIAVILAFALFNTVADLIKKNTEIDENITNTIINNFSLESSSETTTDNLPSVVANYIQDTVSDVANNGIDSVAHNISDGCVKGLSFIGIFVVARIALFIISKIANLVAEIPLIKQVNKAGGIIVGAIKGLLVIYIILAILSFVAPIFTASPLYEMISKSYVVSYMYDNNLLLQFIFHK